jgi:hypothetical protein
MNRSLLLTALTIALLGGTASADHRHGGWGRGNGHWRGGGGGWSAGITVRTPRVFVQPRVVVQQPRVRIVRRPIYVRAPELRVHYYRYEQQPQMLVENYPARDGYYWVAGQWTWSGYEWTWQAGHYEPYQQQPEYYDNGYYQQPAYDQSYYPSQQPCDD